MAEYSQEELIKQYNHDEFVMSKVSRWMKWEASPNLGSKATSFPLWDADTQAETALETWWKDNRYLVVEFGSFT